MKPRCREARHHTSTSKVDDQSVYSIEASCCCSSKSTVISWSQWRQIWRWTASSKLCQSLKPTHYDEKFEKECQPRKDEENPRLQNFPKYDKKFDEGYWHQKFDDNYGKASRVPFWVDTWQDFEDNFVKISRIGIFNPPADEKDEWPTEPRFNFFSTLL